MCLLKAYARLARPDNWFKNIFVVPGTVIAWQLSGEQIGNFSVRFLLGVVAVCLCASANYVINEWFDRDSDQFHPVKRNRPSVVGNVRGTIVAGEYMFLLVAGLSISFNISTAFGFVAIFFLLMGVFYNVRPLRTKDRVYLDVLSESINNPIRLMMGWLVVINSPLPPSSLLLAYWFGGAFLMGVKRYSEYRAIGMDTAGLYRRSFRFYSEEKLLISSLFYGLCSSALGGIFLVKYKVEFVILVPFIALLFAWYFHIGLKPDSVAQYPERMYKEIWFIIYVFLLGILFLTLSIVEIPSFKWLLKNAFLSGDSK